MKVRNINSGEILRFFKSELEVITNFNFDFDHDFKGGK